jgi:hypothetical protein
MIFGLSYWILICFGILLLGALGLASSIQWAQKTEWKNLDEVLRAAGTVIASIGMIILLEYPFSPMPEIGYGLLGSAVTCFAIASLLGLVSRVNRDHSAG